MVAVHSIEVTHEQTVAAVVKPLIIKEVDTHGNTIIKTNDIKIIQTMQQVTTAVQ